jgi:hypothetical protein
MNIRVVWGTALWFLAGASLALAQLTITEFMASNKHTLLDEDGAPSDWIELYNAGTNTVNLEGWHLTDNASNLTKWTFPATNLAPNSFMIVFASGKDRAVAGQQLHTDFALSSSGEYLALVRPDGTVAQDFAPAFPEQVEDISYGFGFNYATNLAVLSGAGAKWAIPRGVADFPAGWMATSFDDSSWSNGFTGLGFSSMRTNLFGTGPATNVAPGKAATQSSSYNNDPTTYGPQKAVDGNYTDFSHTYPTDTNATWEVSLGTNYGLERIVIYNRTDCCQSRLRDITARVLTTDSTATNFISALLNPENILGGKTLSVGPASITLDLTNLTGGLVLGGRVRLTRTPDPDLSGSGGQGNDSESNVLSLAEVEVWAVPSLGVGNVFGDLVKTDISGAMTNVNATALIRLPFDLPSELPELSFLTLQMAYNAGFVVYLNGVELVRRNAPGTLAWNSAATNQQPDAAARQLEYIDISPGISLLQPGRNTLAIQGLNLSATNSGFLILPQVVGTALSLAPGQYFAHPTPGAPNSGGGLGVVADPQVSVSRGLYDTPFTLALTSATANAQIHFTTDGSTPSAVSGMLYTSPVTIAHTTVLRAIATEPGYWPSSVATYTYVLLTNVIAQSLQSATSAGFPAAWSGTTPDYAMDPTVTRAYATQMVASLHSLPSVFITTTVSNLFDPATGIYVNPTQHGLAWERPAAVEMVDTNGQSQFQVGCGLRIQGGAFRNFYYTQKKSLRLLFKSQYGVGRLHYDLFNEPGAAQDFNTLVLRAGANDGYSWADAGTTVQFIRDQFGRRLLLDMGHPSVRGMFVHVYLNGLYWGLYNLTERPNEDFSVSYLGGSTTDWDSFSGNGLKNGDMTAWSTFNSQVAALSTYADYQRLQGNNPDGSRNPSYPLFYDKMDYMDYLLVNIWGGNWDWPSKNYWVGYERTPDSTGFKFYMWDFENTMGNNLDRSPLNAVAPRVGGGNEQGGVGAPHYYLKNFSEYRMDFADRVQRYLFNGGLLTPQVLTNRYRRLADELQPAIVAESARWGDDNHTPAYGLPEWLGERDWILTNYLPQRTTIVLQQLLTSGLYPGVGAPSFSQFGGSVPAGYSLSMAQTNPAGIIYFTNDGSDPRVPGAGTVSSTAQAYSVPVIINAPMLVRARVLSGARWSALVEAIFQPPQDLSKLELTEIMYDPPGIGSTNGDEYEFLELKNTGASALNLSGLTFTSGLHFTFTNGTLLGPGQFFVIGRNAAAFHANYPGVALNGLYTGKLSNGGDTITLSQSNGAQVFSMAYNNTAPWPVTPHGFGYSLVQSNPGISPAPDKAEKWRASTHPGGSPGADDPAPALPGIVVNEVLANSPAPLLDTLELYNSTASDVDISGWLITNDPDVPQKYRIPNRTVLPEGGYICFDESQFNVAGRSNAFAFNPSGDSVYLLSADADGNLTGYDHGFKFGASFPGVSFGRYMDSAGEETFPPQLSRTFGRANSGPVVGPVVINEIQYHPPPGGYEFVELLNITSTNVPLFDPACPKNAWKFVGLGYTFPTNITLGPAQMLLLVQTNPASFQAKYGVRTNVVILGPYPGSLSNGGDDLQLQVPGGPGGTNPPPYVTIEEVKYNTKLPWPPAADGSGPSLQRVSALAYGNDPANWFADLQTPGAFNPKTDSNGQGIPDAWMVLNFGHVAGEASDQSRATDDPDGDGFTNLQEYLAGTNPHDANSALKLLNVSVTASAVNLEFMAASNHAYSVLYRGQLTDPVWLKLTNVPAPPADGVINVSDPSPDPNVRFYRLVTPAQP